MNKIILNAIDLFAGAGGLSLGISQAGFNIIYANEMNKNASDTYRYNFVEKMKHGTFIDTRDISRVEVSEIRRMTKGKHIHLIAGGPPCQGFSLAGNIGRKCSIDKRNELFLEFVRIVDSLQPEFFLMENVASIARHRNGKTVSEIKSNFERIGYKTNYSILDAVNYGVPQYRKRIFFIGNRIGSQNPFPKATHDQIKKKFLNVQEVIGDLPELGNGEKNCKIPNHEAMLHTEGMLNKMRYVKDGGNRFQIPNKFRPKKGDARKYIRYKSNAPSVCITGDMRKVFHYSQNRALTVRELARIQTFPDDFQFLGNRISQQLQVGNAVPPNLARAVAKEIWNKLSVCGDNYGCRIAIQKVSTNKFYRK